MLGLNQRPVCPENRNLRNHLMFLPLTRPMRHGFLPASVYFGQL
jgi:hypothetical protein